MKASVLFYEEPNSVPVVYMLRGFKKKRNLKSVNLVNQKITKYLKKKTIYMLQENFKYILLYLDYVMSF